MSKVEVHCSNCQKAYRVKSESLGKKAKCSGCDQVFVIETPVEKSTPIESEDSLLLSCPYCGFQDSGNFCSDCGGRLREITALDFESCKISAHSAASCLAAAENNPGTWSADDLEDEKYELSSSFESFNDFIKELARAWRYEEGSSRRYKFDRAEVARQIDELPRSLSGRQKIADRLWTLIGQAEREISQDELDTLVKDALAAVAGLDINRTERLIVKIQALISDAPWLKGATNLEKLETAHQQLLDDEATDTRRVAFEKLLTKADKFAFLKDGKKAVKAYLECLFWLTRNELPDKEQIERDTQSKLDAAQATLDK